MKLKSLKDAKISDKTVLLTVDYNVPLVEKQGELVVEDDNRIASTIPTIKLLLKNNCKIIVLTKLGRPGGKVVSELKLDPIAKHLEKLLDHPVKKIDQVVGPEIVEAVEQLQTREILMLENVQFHPGDEENDLKLAKDWADLADVVVNEAFGRCHRNQASVTGIGEYLPMLAGLQLEKEVEMLSGLMEDPKRPFVTVVGGAKISDKVEVIRNLAKLSDVVLVGGGVANNFLKAEGINVLHSYLEEAGEKKKQSFVAVADDLLEENRREKMMLNGFIPLPRIIYPSDVVAGKNVEEPGSPRVVDLTQGEAEIEEDVGNHDDYMYLDIGPKTQQLYSEIIQQAGTVFWNGPMGVFEQSEFAEGTRIVAEAMADSKAKTVVGGGDTVAAIGHFGLHDKFNFVSTAGGASLEFLSGKELPGLKLMKKE